MSLGEFSILSSKSRPPSDWDRIDSNFRLNQFNPTQDNLSLLIEILRQAKNIVKHTPLSTLPTLTPFVQQPWGEFDLEESLDCDPFLNDPNQIWMETLSPIERPVSLIIDLSSSMSGEKHFLSSLAVAIYLLTRDPVHSGIVAFNSNAQVIKAFGQTESPVSVLRRFVNYTPRGFTHLRQGLETSLKDLNHIRKRRALLIFDGQWTEGEDPLPLAKQFHELHVLHLHGTGSRISFSKEIAKMGNGKLFEIASPEDLPTAVNKALKELAL